VTEVAIEQAKKRCPSADIRVGDLKQTDFADGFFDVIICTEVIEHIHDYSLVLDEFKRILSPEGILIITFPNEFLWTMARILLGRKPIKVPDHVNSFSPTGLTKEMKMKIMNNQGLPFGLSFAMSLGYLLVAKK